MKEKGKIAAAVINRLPKYYMTLRELSDMGIKRISSKDLGMKMRVTASQIRQDLNNFGDFGLQGYGYEVDMLRDEIGKIIGLEEKHSMIIIGDNNLDQISAGMQMLSSKSFIPVGIFDRSQKLDGVSLKGLKIKSLDRLPRFLRTHSVDIAMIAVHADEVENIAQMIVENGIKQVVNFTNADLYMGEDIVVENINISEVLMRLSLRILLKRKQCC